MSRSARRCSPAASRPSRRISPRHRVGHRGWWRLGAGRGVRGAAQARQAASNFNWLNIGYFDSGTGAIAHASPFSDPVSAAEQTAKFLKGQWGGASTGIQDILNTVGKPPDDQMMAIANSGWASSHYNNGANLRATFEELANMKIVTAPAAAAASAAAAGPAGPVQPWRHPRCPERGLARAQPPYRTASLA